MKCFAEFCRFAVAVAAVTFTTIAQAQTDAGSVLQPQPEVLPGIPPAVPPSYVVCPPKHSPTVFVPANLLLQQADSLQPETPAGWIVTNRPVPTCDNHVPDAATREYRDITYPLQIRQLDTQIRLTQYELANWLQRIDEYRYFNKTGVLMVDFQNSQLTALALHEKLRNLRYERMLVIRHRNRELAIEKEALAARVAAAETK